MRVLCGGRGTSGTDLGVVTLSEIDDLDHHGSADHDVVGLEVQVHDPVLFQVPHTLRQHEEDVDLGAEGETEFLGEHVLNEVGEEDIIGQQVVLQRILLGGDVVFWDKERIAALDLLEDVLLVLDPVLHLPALDRRQSLLPLDHHHLPDHLLGSEALVINRSHHLVVVARIHVPKLHLRQVNAGEAAVVDQLQVQLVGVFDPDAV